MLLTPPGLPLLPFQVEGVEFLRRTPAALLADQAGCGKTIQAIALVNSEASVRKVLVVCPASLKLNWAQEIARWTTRPVQVDLLTPGLTAKYVSGGEAAPNMVRWCIINYDILHRWVPLIQEEGFDLILMDEATALKNPKAKRTKAAVSLRATRRVLMTGTPIQNRPVELWPLIHYLDPKTWPSFWTFVHAHCAAKKTHWGWDFTGASNLPELRAKLDPIMIARRKSDVLKDLPEKRYQVLELPQNGSASVVQAELVAMGELERLDAKLAAAPADTPTEQLAALKAGRRVAFEEVAKRRHDTAMAKAPTVLEHVRWAISDGAKLVLWVHHRDVADVFIAALGAEAVVIRGGMTPEEKNESVVRFQTDPKIKVAICSLTAAGVGLTLTASSHAIFAELDYRPGVMEQACDRQHRIGQKEAVLIQYLVLERSIDARIAHALVQKQGVIDVFAGVKA